MKELRKNVVSVVGFGGRTPPLVVDTLAELKYQVDLVRSPAMELALLKSRCFLSNDKFENGSMVIYQLPSSWIEGVGSYEEANLVRMAVMDPSTVVVGYNVSSKHFVGGTSSDVLLAIEDKAIRNALANAVLKSLGELDIQVSEATASDTVIVVGGGGREHALAVQLARSPQIGTVLCCPGNGGTARESNPKIQNRGDDQSHRTVLELARSSGAKMVVVGPEAPLVEGLVDLLNRELPHVLCFGPTQAAAQLEASKAFAKDFLHEQNIPTASYKNFTDANEAVAYVKSLDIDGTGNKQVVKASGLAAGKGVLLPENEADTIAAVHEIMSDKAFGTAGDTCVIESFLIGPEASCLAFCDGKTAKLLPAAQDHKRALDFDQGLNTGGMGAYAPAPCVTPDLQTLIESYCVKSVAQMAKRGTPYVGILYAGMMLTPNGPFVLEFNCRFGDPEAQVLLPLLETDLYEILTACCTSQLDSVDVRIRENAAAATVVCASLGYPQSYPKGMRITGLDNVPSGVKVYHAGTVLDDQDVIRCSGGRVLAVTGFGACLSSALKAAYKGVSQIDFVNDREEQKSLLHRRTDIGRRAVEKKLRIGVLGSTRGTALLPVIEACRNGSVHAEIVAVVSNKSSAPILEKGESLKVLTKAISSKGLTREQFDAECTATLVGAGVDYVLLIGYMRILSKPFTDYWHGRCINVHPSLLPKHAGGMDLAVHQAVIDANEEETGCTIHQVTEEVDGGPIVVQKRVKVDASDTAESLKAKVQPLEGPAFVEAIQMHCRREVISYADAGVSIDAGNKLVDLIKPYCKSTRRAGCDAELGGFGGLFDLAAAGFDSSDTVLIGATDGVGTKLRIAQKTGKHETIGIDLVAMCVNDLIVAGGEPLFFLDYFATGHLEINEAAIVIKGIAEGCRLSNCGLIGGETAEMPSMYGEGDYDLAGFAVGAVHRQRVLPQNVAEGDVVLGIPSSGIHSNGYSLVRKLVEKEGLSFESPCPWDSSAGTVGYALLVPTKIYVASCLPLIKKGVVKALAHITGGGLLENLPRSLPDNLSAKITSHPPLTPVFKWLKQSSGLGDSDMLTTFNCGVGMIIVVSREDLEVAKELLFAAGETHVHEMGVLVKGNNEVILAVNLD